MNSIDGALARIQEILTRIHEIRATDGRVSGTGPSAPVGPSQVNTPQAPSAPKVAATPAGSPGQSSATGAPKQGTTPAGGGLTRAQALRFEQLLQQSLATGLNGIGGTTGGTGPASGASGLASGAGGLLSGALGGGANLANLQSLLGSAAQTGSSTPANSQIQNYQAELLKALQEIAAQRKQGPM